MTGMHAPTLLLVVVIISFAWALALASVGLPRKKDLILCASVRPVVKAKVAYDATKG